jgi:putative transposase
MAFWGCHVLKCKVLLRDSTFLQSNNYQRDRKRYARKHLRVSRQRRGFVEKEALCVIKSNDFIAYENLNIQGMVKNSKLAKSINDVAWSTFRQWLEYFGFKYGKATVAVALP